jgi:hypothetical protein
VVVQVGEGQQEELRGEKRHYCRISIDDLPTVFCLFAFSVVRTNYNPVNSGLIYLMKEGRQDKICVGEVSEKQVWSQRTGPPV